MNVIEWLMDADPAIRWQVMSDLTDARPAEVAAERARVATEGWGAQLLALQGPDGRWDGGTYRPGWVDESKPFFDAWTATHFSLWLLRDLGLVPGSPEARHAVSLVRENVRWEANGALYFEGETEPCINGIALASGAYFGEDVGGIAERLVAEAQGDGGWNCWAGYGAKVSSFHSTLCVLEGLLEWERAGKSCCVVVRRDRSSTRGSRCSRSPRGGTTTCCAHSTTSEPPDRRRTIGSRRRSPSSRANAARTAGGRSRTRTKGRRISRWTVLPKASRAGGTPSVRCGSSDGRIRQEPARAHEAVRGTGARSLR